MTDMNELFERARDGEPTSDDLVLRALWREIGAQVPDGGPGEEDLACQVLSSFDNVPVGAWRPRT